MNVGTKPVNAPDDWLAFAMRLRDDTKRQIVDLKKLQTELQHWYSTKPGKPSKTLELDECPGLLRVMQTIRLMRETLAELEQELGAREGLSVVGPFCLQVLH